MKNHLVILSYSIFDNAAYVNGAPAVIDQVRQLLSDSPDWQVSLLEVAKANLLGRHTGSEGVTG